MIKLYTNTNFLSETYRRQVFPLLFDLAFKKDEQLLEYYQLVNQVKDADVVVFPIDYALFIKDKDATDALLSEAKLCAKPIWIYTAGDYGFTNYIDNAYTFRLGGFKSKLNNKTFILPSFINDPYTTFLDSRFEPITKSKQPKIGFVGHAQLGFKKWIKEFFNHLKYIVKRKFKGWKVDKQAFYPSSIKRAGYLQTLSKNESIHSNFILRNKYRAGLQNEQTKIDSSKVFYNNIYNTAYTFCIRGVGNFSVRFYETLAVGRIPILIDTDCKLPLDQSIDWSKHCLIIDSNSKIPIATQLLEFHNSLSEEAFKNIQQSNRELWLTLLKREAYFKHIHNHFKTELL
ncbi:hypothetical protein [Mesoflavibacter profundi]|uniref:hypothetical protein n=1 Tax=Mesoflavibacter profundi TaxID=2708110 RepID=UPI003518B52F